MGTTYLRSVQFRVYEQLNYVRSSLMKKAPKTKFIYFAHSRSGSHLFADLINTHPDVMCVTEYDLFLRRKEVRHPVGYIDGVSKRFRHAPVFGGKISLRQLSRQTKPIDAVIRELAAREWKFILLERENTLNQTVSALLAKQRKTYHDTVQPTVEQLQITVDLQELHKKLTKKTETNQMTRALLAPYDPLTIIYERDLVGEAAQQHTADRVFALLGLEPCVVQTNFVRTGVYAMSDYITNYDEMVTSLQGTPFVHFLPTD